MVHPFRKFMTKRIQLAVLGNPVRDAYLDVDTIEFPEHRAHFRKGAAWFDIAYQGDTIRFGEKRYAQSDLSAIDMSPFTVRNGGGIFHTGTQLARLCAQRRLLVTMSAIDLVTPWPELEAAYAQAGIAHLSLALVQPATNLVLTNGKPDRLILKSPDPIVALTPAHRQQLRRLLPHQLDLLVVNSLRSTDLARVVMHHAQQVGAAQYSVLTPSLALDARIDLQLRHDRASVCNLSEFALIAQALGIDCPTDEEDAPLPAIAQAMLALARQGKVGDLVVTLGSRGCLTGDRLTGTLAHVALDEGYRQTVQAQLQAHPERKNGVGDRFFGSFVLAHALAKPRTANRTAYAACVASVEMICQLAPTLTPAHHWLVERPLGRGFGVRRGHQPPKAHGEKTTRLPQWPAAPAAAALL